MQTHGIIKPSYRRETSILLIALLLILLMTSCQTSHTVPIDVQDHNAPSGDVYGRIDISADYLSVGLRQLFAQVSKQCGPFDTEPIIKDYVGLIQQGLYYHGICSIERLNVNGTTIDIDIFFRKDRTPALLRMEAYVHGTSRPMASLASNYFSAY